jgi:hypothetical protein
MAMVRFAQTCDVPTPTGVCGQRSEEYTTWATCRECGNDVCEAHEAPDSRQEREVVDEYGNVRGMRYTCICPECTPRQWTCPVAKTQPDGAPHTIIGCGTTFMAVPDAEGLVDCPNCGIWFNPTKEVI